ncbi:MAG: DUF167 family protein [Candidatus Margulisbacteria bacterium]|nr:DUF167 family protein [Candidatus Margulisiibacteriota bacterium]
MQTKPKLLHVKTITNAKKCEIIYENEDHLKIKLNIIPEKGKANKKIIDILAKQLKIPKKKLKIISGELSHNKILAIEDFIKPLQDFFN